MSSVDFRPLFEDNPNAIIVFDRETLAILAANDAACRHFGYSREELLGRDVAALRPPEEADRMRAAYAKARAEAAPEGPTAFPGAWRQQRKDGTIVDVEIWRMRIAYEGRAAVMAVIQDVTERNRDVAALRSSQERYQRLFEATPVPLFVFDADTLRYLAANDAALRKYGYSREELLGMTVLDIRPPEDVPRLRDALRLVDGGNVDTGVWRHRKRDGSFIEVEITAHAIEFAGRPARLAVAQDVTERRRLEEQLRQSQKMEATGLLAGGIAHDFNNLLGVVLGAAELGRRAVASGRSADEYLLEIERAATRAAELTRKLLAFSRKQVLQMRTLDLNETVEDFLQLLRRVIGEDVELVVQRAQGRLVVTADASQLEQVLLNLCTNARQAMPSGGRIVLETRHARFDEAFVAREPWATVGDWAELRVVDSGEGMDPATRARIFEPFFTTKREGTGLGLAMVHGIVHQHHGLLHVESEPGKGTAVQVFLPLKEGAALTPGRTTSSGTLVRGGNETLLVGEDEPALRRLLASTLRGLGYEVITAEDGEEATQAFETRRGQIALVILDVVMPRLGGVQAFERMRALDPSLRVIFTTGYAPESGQVSDLVAQEGHALLTKPFTLKELGRKVRETLDARP